MAEVARASLDGMRGHLAAAKSPGFLSIGLGLLLVIPVIVFAPAPPQSDVAPVEAFHGRIVALLGGQRTDLSQPDGGFLPDARVELLDGPDAGQQLDAYLQAPGESQLVATYEVGDEVVVTRTVTPDGPPFVAVVDRWRLPQLLWLVILLAVAAVATAGWRGLRAIASLALTAAVVIRILIPGALAGIAPVPLAIGLSMALAVVTIAWTEGVTRASMAAILGTASALGLAAILGAASVELAGFSNAAGSELVFFQTSGGAGLDLRGLLLAAFVIGALGVLVDVTVTQAAAVAELHERAGLSGRALYASGSAVGRSHSGASINTLFLAYAGAALPALLVLAASAQPLILVLNSETTAGELVRTIVGSIGLLAAVPATTAIATILLSAPRRDPSAPAAMPLERWWLARLGALAVAACGVLLLALIAGSMVGTPPHQAAVPDVLAPPSVGTEAGSTAAAGGQTGTPAPDGAGDSPPVFDIGQSVALAELGGQPATIVVLHAEVTTAAADTRRVEVELQFTSPVALDVAPGDWRLLTEQGSEHEAAPDRSRGQPLVATTLVPDRPLAGWLEFTVSAAEGSGFLEFLDTSGRALFLVSLF
jgi:uncharacterized membrane protein